MSSKFFTGIFRALADPIAHFDTMKEINAKAAEKIFFDSLAGKSTFQAVVLPEKLGSTDQPVLGQAIRVRPIDLHDFMIPEPCQFSDPKKIEEILSLHPIAYPSETIPYNSNIKNGTATDVQKIAFGDTVECYFTDGPQTTGRLRGLRYRKGTGNRTNAINLACLRVTSRDDLGSVFSRGGLTAGKIDPREEFKIKPSSSSDPAVEESTEIETIPGAFFPIPQDSNYYLSSLVGLRTDPVSRRPDTDHAGIDFAVAVGTPVFAALDGKIDHVSDTPTPARGIHVIIDHGYIDTIGSTVKTRYYHLNNSFAKKGDSVMAGDAIGRIGTTGKSTGYHLHMELRFSEKVVDPIRWLGYYKVIKKWGGRKAKWLDSLDASEKEAIKDEK